MTPLLLLGVGANCLPLIDSKYSFISSMQSITVLVHADAHVVHSNCACTARSVNYILHIRACYQNFWTPDNMRKA